MVFALSVRLVMELVDTLFLGRDLRCFCFVERLLPRLSPFAEVVLGELDLLLHPRLQVIKDDPAGLDLLIKRGRLVARCASRPIAHVATEMGISRRCASKWVVRHREHGEAGLEDASSRPEHSPNATPQAIIDRIIVLRKKKWAATRIAHELALENVTIVGDDRDPGPASGGPEPVGAPGPRW